MAADVSDQGTTVEVLTNLLVPRFASATSIGTAYVCCDRYEAGH